MPFPLDGSWDRYRVLDPDYPGAIATSEVASVVIEKPVGAPWTIEEAPVLDSVDAVEAIEALAVAPWHDAGEGGAGVSVAVFDVQWFNAAALADELGAYTTQDCEAHRSCEIAMDTFRPRYTWEEGSHGVACAETIRDLAPEAELHLVRVNGTTTFENAVQWAIRNEIDVVSMSMSFFDNSFHDGTGSLNDAAARLNDAGVLLVNSAGNYATEQWLGDFVDADGDGKMEFPWGSEFLPVEYEAGTRAAIVSWDQFATCGDTDLDVYAYARDGSLVGRGEDVQAPGEDGCSPVERLSLHCEESDWYWLQIVRKSGDPSVRVGVFGRGGNVWEHNAGSLADPASYAGAFTVGAVRAGGYLENGAEFFSSRGPTRAGIDKPDIAGPNGLSTETYGPVGFYGTSAATPAVAGAIALLLGEDPSLTPEGAAERLRATAIGEGSTWDAHDGALGAGRARLPAPGSRAPEGACGGSGGAALAPCLLWWGRHRRRGCP